MDSCGRYKVASAVTRTRKNYGLATVRPLKGARREPNQSFRLESYCARRARRIVDTYQPLACTVFAVGRSPAALRGDGVGVRGLARVRGHAAPRNGLTFTHKSAGTAFNGEVVTGYSS